MQHGAMRKSDTCACNSATQKPTRRGPANGPVALHTSPYVSTPFPPPGRSGLALGTSYECEARGDGIEDWQMFWPPLEAVLTEFRSV